MSSASENIKNGKPPAAGSGRLKGSKNRSTEAIRQMIVNALDKAGGESYLYQQAIENPVAFMTLIGKVIPKDVSVTGSLIISHEDALKELK